MQIFQIIKSYIESLRWTVQENGLGFGFSFWDLFNVDPLLECYNQKEMNSMKLYSAQD